MNDYKEKIVGFWKNNRIEYKFESDGKLSICWVKEKSRLQGTWLIKGDDEIIFNYGDGIILRWKGRINSITSNELYITDDNSVNGSIDVFYKVIFVENDLIQDGKTVNSKNLEKETLENPLSNEIEIEALPKKSLKEKVIDFTTSFFGIALFVVIIVGFLYFCYKGFVRESHIIQSFTAGIIFLSISTFMIFHHLSEDIKVVKFTDNLLVILLVAIIALPLLYIGLQILFLVLMLWYLMICVVAIICIIFVLRKKTLKLIYKILIISTMLASVYFLFDAKNILEINLDVHFNRKKVEFFDFD